MIRRLDVALWRLPRWARKAIIAPLGVAHGLIVGLSEGFSQFRTEFRAEWTSAMRHVHDRPEEAS